MSLLSSEARAESVRSVVRVVGGESDGVKIGVARVDVGEERGLLLEFGLLVLFLLV